ncbi:MAG TPA: response regulator [Alphaproteobacteria bacterium]|jgi:CheY-like chemotaxis protein
MIYKGLKVLVVEDSHTTQAVITRILASIGVEFIYTALNGNEGLEIVHKEDPDLVIVDWEMPQLDGIGFTQAVRTGDDMPDNTIPILMCTTHYEISRVMQARAAGVNEFITKPFTEKELLIRLQHALCATRRYIVSDTYTGPDRRRLRKGPAGYQGPDRRTGLPENTAPDTKKS